MFLTVVLVIFVGFGSLYAWWLAIFLGTVGVAMGVVAGLIEFGAKPVGVMILQALALWMIWFGNIEMSRLQRGWTQEDLAHKTGLATVQISRIERGRREVRLTTLLRLIRALDVAPAELLDGVV